MVNGRNQNAWDINLLDGRTKGSTLIPCGNFTGGPVCCSRLTVYKVPITLSRTCEMPCVWDLQICRHVISSWLEIRKMEVRLQKTNKIFVRVHEHNRGDKDHRSDNLVSPRSLLYLSFYFSWQVSSILRAMNKARV